MKKGNSNKYLVLFALFGFFGFRGFAGIEGVLLIYCGLLLWEVFHIFGGLNWINLRMSV